MPPVTLRHRVHRLLDGSSTPAATALRLALAALIVVNVVAVVAETVPCVAEAAGDLLAALETFSLVVFTAEYALRLWSAGEYPHFRGALGRVRWALTPGALVDLLAVAPGLLFAGGGDCRVVRILRLARLVRVVKLGRYSIALRTLRHVLTARLPELVSLAFVLLILLVLSSAAMYHLEHDAQPEAFSSIPAAMWWGIVTLTTIGYGDMTPVTTEGRMLGSLVAVLGIGMFALPAGLLGGAFVEELGRVRRAAAEPATGPSAAPTTAPLPTTGATPAPTRCPHCQKPLA